MEIKGFPGNLNLEKDSKRSSGISGFRVFPFLMGGYPSWYPFWYPLSHRAQARSPAASPRMPPHPGCCSPAGPGPKHPPTPKHPACQAARYGTVRDRARGPTGPKTPRPSKHPRPLPRNLEKWETRFCSSVFYYLFSVCSRISRI